MRRGLNGGLTLIEVLVSMAVIAVVVGLISPSFVNFRSRTALKNDSELLANILKEARSRSVASDGDSAFGVHFESDKAVLFKGAVYASSSPENKIAKLDGLTAISEIELSGGGTEVLFEKITGGTENYGTTTLVLSADLSKKREVVVNKTGVIEVK